MKKLAILIVLFAVAAPLLAQRNRITSRPFDWQKIETQDGKYVIHFPKGMEAQATFVASEVQKISLFYSQKVFEVDYPIINSPKKSSWLGKIGKIFGAGEEGGNFEKDSTGKPITQKIFWEPDQVIINLYPNLNDYNQQRVIDTFIPPGVLGFTEALHGNRVAYPFAGNYFLFRLVNAHEIAHAWKFEFMSDWRRIASKTKLEPIRENWQGGMRWMPPWVVEGFAELLARKYLASLGIKEDSRLAQVSAFNLERGWGGKIPSLSSDYGFEGFENYSFGFDFLNFVQNKYSFKPFIELWKRLAEGKRDFKDAWFSAFGKSLEDLENEWLKSIKIRHYNTIIGASVDTLKIRYALAEFGGIAGRAGYDSETQSLAYYKEDEKWGLRVFFTNPDWRQEDVIEISRQFKDKSLFYRIYNAPAVFQNRVAIVVTKENVDRIQLFEIDKKRAKEPVKLLYEHPLPSLSLINDVSFITPDSIVLAGTNQTGQVDIYAYNFKTRVLTRLTDNSEEEREPKFWNENLFFIQVDSLDKHSLLVKNSSGLELVEFGNDGFLSELTLGDSLIVLRSLQVNGLSKLIIWPSSDDTAYEYREGENVKIDSTYLRIPRITPQQILGLRDKKLLILEQANREENESKILSVDLDDVKNLNALRVTKSKIEPATAPPVSEKSPYKIEKGDKKFRYPTVFRDNFDGGYKLALANATGEYALSGMAQATYDAYWGFLYWAEFNYYDFSKRMQSVSGLSGGRYWSFRNSLLIRGGDDRKRGLIFDELIEAKRAVIWPFDLENSMGASLGLGYLSRTYFDTESDEGRKLATPFLKTALRFTSDASFIDPIRSSRHGHFYKAGIEAAFGKKVGLFDGRLVGDARYYLRPWNASPYFAFRLTAGETFGRDARWFFLTELYRKAGFVKTNFDKSFGDRFLMYQGEFRLPFVRLALFKYKFWKSPTPIFLFSVNAFTFLYGGGINWRDEPFAFTHRAGYGFKFGFFFLPVYLRFERFAHLDNLFLKKTFFFVPFPNVPKGSWQNAWTVEVEY